MLLLHRGRRLFVALISFMVMVTTTVTELIYMAVMPREAALSGALFEENAVLVYAGYLFLSAVMFTLVVVLLRTFIRRDEGDTMNRVWLLLPIFPVCQFATMAVFYNAYIEIGSISGHILWMILIYVVSDIVLFFTIRTMTRNAELSARNSVLEEQVNSQAAYYEQLAGSYEEIRRMRHDIDNHLYTVQALVAEGRVEQALQYSGSLLQEDRTKQLFSDCLNTVAATYLEKKSDDLSKQGIRFESDVHIPGEPGISNPDLICMLGNLLDNAAEACREAADPFIDLKVNMKEPYLQIVCRNSLPEEHADLSSAGKARRIPELKRGVGFTILRTLADRYDGEFTYHSENGIFHANMIVKGTVQK